MAELVRIGVFYDGNYFSHVSDYYRYHHERGARISIQGFHEFVREEVAKRENTDSRYCKIVEAHYFRGRFPAEDADRHGALLRERKFEDVLVKAGVTPHFLLMSTAENEAGDEVVTRAREKGIDVWLALEAYESALRKSLDVVVLVTGDGDFLHLARKLVAAGSRIMVTAWGFEIAPGGPGTRTSGVLLDAVTYPVMMDAIIDGERGDNPVVDNLFVPRLPGETAPDAKNAERVEGVGRRISRTDGAAAEERQQADGAAGSPASTDWSTGSVANLPHGKDFGFIQPDAGGENLFFYKDWVEGCEFRDLKVGDAVRFVFATNPRDGRPNARRVSRGLVA